jgi:DNA-directed RNA polymerase I and III subunit RPAC2
MKKIKIILQKNNKNASFILHNEDHTIGNLIRYIANKDPNIIYFGYNIPHPSEKMMNFKITSKRNHEQINSLILSFKICLELMILFVNVLFKNLENTFRFSA